MSYVAALVTDDFYSRNVIQTLEAEERKGGHFDFFLRITYLVKSK